MKSLKTLISCVIAFSFCLGVCCCPASADGNNINANTTASEPCSDYEEYINFYANEQYPQESISVYAKDAVLENGASVISVNTDDTSETAVSFNASGNKAGFKFEVSNAGLYNITLYYRVCETDFNLSPIEIDVSVDSAVSGFNWLKNLELDRIWQDAGEVLTDEFGNESAPAQEELFIRNSMKLKDIYSRPLYHYFDAGIHMVEIEIRKGAFELYCVEFSNDKKAVSYKEYSLLKAQKAEEYCEKIEAESYSAKSSASIVPECDPTSVDTTPNSPTVQKLNYISGAQYKTAGSWIEWKINVPSDGYYIIDMRVRQNYNSGLSSIRSLTIDGELPFEEAAEISFPYTDSWEICELGNEEQFKFYLTAGEHTLRLSCAYGYLAEVVAFSQNVILNLNSLYNSVIMKVGTNPDKYRDYNLGQEISGIDQTLKDIYDDIITLGKMVVSTNNGKTGSAMSTIQTVETMLKNFIKDPDELAMKMESFKSNIESLATWANSLNEQPLDIDWIRIYSENTAITSEKASFIQKVKFNIIRLCASFSSEYDLKGDTTGKDSLKVWVSAGRDQLKVIKKLTSKGFEKEYNADVTLAINTDITGAVLAGVGPDICLFMDSGSPSVFAVRNVLVDLSQFDDFDNIIERFGEGAVTPFSSIGGCYALPLSLSWPMLFVRNDIFEDLELTVPETWDEMYTVAAVLQRNHLEIGIPSHVGMFFTLLYQNGGSVFNENLETTFNDQYSLKAFSTWVSFFSEYSFPLTYDFFNRFRSGEMPIGIADYTTYAQLKAAAPEIRGQWQMYPVPGIKDENGETNHLISTSSATGSTQANGLQQGESAVVMFKDSKNKQLAWDYICWFTSESVQVEYGLDIEAALGYTGRYATANQAALAKLPWTADELDMLYSARKNVVLIDEYPGNYYIAREVNNAFRSVVNEGTNPADILTRKNVLINKELSRKYKQFDIEAGGEKND